MIRAWFVLLPLTIVAQDFEILNTACYDDAKLLICSKFYSDVFAACEENTDISHLSYHRPTDSICVKKHTELCISGDFCPQAETEAAPIAVIEHNLKPFKNPELERLEDPNIQFKLSTDEDRSREVKNINLLYPVDRDWICILFRGFVFIGATNSQEKPQ